MTMKKITLLLLGCLLTTAWAGAELKVLTVDMGHLYDNYYKTQQANERLRASVEQAEEEARAMAEEGQSMVEQFEELREQAENPALTDTARQTAQEEAQALIEDIRNKEREVQNFRRETQRTLQQRQQAHRELMIDQIKAVVMTVNEEMNADLIFDTSDVIGSGVPTVLFARASMDITPRVLERLNADAPSDWVPSPVSDN